MNSRDSTDPENRYRSEGPRHVDRLAARVLPHLPGATVERTRDVIQIDWGGEEGIVVIVTPEALEFRLPAIEWTMGAYGPALSSKFWRRVEVDGLDDAQIIELIDATNQARQAEYRTCRFCGKRYPPERRVEDDVCHGCATKHLGVVFERSCRAKPNS